MHFINTSCIYVFSAAVSPKGHVVVLSTPIILEKFNAPILNALPNRNSSFICFSFANHITYQWIYTRDNSIVSNDDQLSLRSTAIAGGIYQCRVSNHAGVGTDNSTLNGKINWCVHTHWYQHNVTIFCSPSQLVQRWC